MESVFYGLKTKNMKNRNEVKERYRLETRREVNMPLGDDFCYTDKYVEWLEEMVVKNCSIPDVSSRYFVFSGQEDGKPTKYLVDDCKDRETAIAKIETEYPNFKWVMTETFNGC